MEHDTGDQPTNIILSLEGKLTAAQDRIKELKGQVVHLSCVVASQEGKAKRIADLQSRLLAHELRYGEMQKALKQNRPPCTCDQFMGHAPFCAVTVWDKALASPLPVVREAHDG